MPKELLNYHKLHLHINYSIQPVAQPHHRIPFHVGKLVRKKLEKSEGWTPWVLPVVIVPQLKNPNDIRICMDMQAANKAIKIEHHITPTVDEIVSDQNNACIFSKLDLNQRIPSNRACQTIVLYYNIQHQFWTLEKHWHYKFSRTQSETPEGISAMTSWFTVEVKLSMTKG